jgi:hypothetical protein
MGPLQFLEETLKRVKYTIISCNFLNLPLWGSFGVPGDFVIHWVYNFMYRHSSVGLQFLQETLKCVKYTSLATSPATSLVCPCGAHSVSRL